MRSLDLTVSDLPSFLIGLFFNLLSLQHQEIRRGVRALHGLDPDAPDPDLRRALAERAVTRVLEQFPELRRAELIEMLENGLAPDPGPPPKLRAV